MTQAKNKVREITLEQDKGVFSIFKRSSKESYDFESLSALRKILSNERARILHVIKHEEPVSIYNLSKKLNRSFRSVFNDVHLLKRFGFIEIINEKTKNRVRHRPIISAETITLNLKI